VGGMTGGSFSAVLLNIPGTPSASATALDGFPMAARGEAGRALGIAITASFIGGLFSFLCLFFIAPLLADVALEFRTEDMFSLVFFGLTIICSFAAGSLIKGLLSAALGLALVTIGQDPVMGTQRFTFGQANLMAGVHFLTAMIGLFAIPQLVDNLMSNQTGRQAQAKLTSVLPRLSDLKAIRMPVFIGSMTGAFLGMLPGAGGPIAAFISYDGSRKVSKNPERFGQGCAEGVAAPESANNAAAGGSLIPLFTLGIPGSGTTAVLLGILISMGIRPGTGNVFEESPELIWTLIASMFIGNAILLMLNFPLVNVFVQILKIPSWFLMPVILVISYIGVYSVNNSALDITIMTIFGVIGSFARKMDIPLAPILLGLILGDDLEQNFRRSLVADDGNYLTFLNGPLNIGLAIAVVFVLFLPQILDRFRGGKVKEEFADPGAEV